VKIKKIIDERLSHKTDRVDAAADINAVVATNVNEPGSVTSVSNKQRVVQRTPKKSKEGR
jgi:hypothetical protein